ncbi:MAG: SusC/RagA family TonB-linked outer membrane protein [Bacteroidota bacterium]|nr:SusC/RagA family TonB-linked outer membrane protein [Bacteroidota bacterium]
MHTFFKISNRVVILSLATCISFSAIAQVNSSGTAARRPASSADANQQAIDKEIQQAKAKKNLPAKNQTSDIRGKKINVSARIDPNDKSPKVSGIIRDAATGKPMPAVNISIPEFSAALTDDNGKFIIKVPDYNATLFISTEGYQSKEVALKGRKKITASLYDEAFNSFYDNAVLPQGTKSLNQVVNAVTSINTDGNWGRSTETPDGFLQGKAAGLNATMRSGTPGVGAYMIMRGYNSLYATNQPLIVVDGMIYDINDYGSSIIANHYTNALSDIDVRDIANVTVMKDGSSLYGTKGANGVILITTNHAQQLATKIDFGVYGGVNLVPNKLPVMGVSDYRTYLSDVLGTSGMTSSQIQGQPYMNDDPSNPDYYKYHANTNWQDKVFKNSATNNYYMKISGGDNIAKYALSLGYTKNGGITSNTDYSKYSVRFNSDLNLSNRLKATTNLSYTFTQQNLRDQGQAYETNPIYLSLVKAPFLNTNDVDSKGAVSPNIADADIFGVSNPVAAIANIIDRSRYYRFFGSVGMNYTLTRNITLATLVGVTVDEVREQMFIPRKGIVNDTLSNAIADSKLGNQVRRIFTLYNDTYIGYKKIFNRIHSLDVRAGLRYQSTKSEQDYIYGYNSATDNFISVGTGVNLLRKVGGDLGKYNWMNTYANVDYSLFNKYFFNASVGIDGSSRFGTQISDALNIGGYRYAVMPSVGASWLVSSEKFMAKYKFVDLLKIRATISKAGNDDIGNYSAQQLYVSQNLLGMQGLIRGNIANPGLQWETVTRFNGGIDLSLFNERLNISTDIYHNQTDNMVVYEPAPVASGFQYMITNGGGMKTNGIDITVNGRVINKPSFKWDAGITFSTFKNRITSVPGGSVITNVGGASILSQVGAPAGLFYGYKTTGVYSSDAEAAAAGLMKRMNDGSYAPFKGGDVRFVDVNGDKIIDDKDKQYIGNPTPDYVGAITNKLTYKRITLEAVITFSVGNKVYNGVRAALESMSGTNNQLKSVVNRWRATGQVTNMPKATWGDPMGNSSFSDRWIEDGSFARLKMITLSYALPIKGGKLIKYATLYATGNNLVTLTKYLGYDPEFYPAESVLARGVDVGLEPQFKSLSGGLRIGL